MDSDLYVFVTHQLIETALKVNWGGKEPCPTIIIVVILFIDLF